MNDLYSVRNKKTPENLIYDSIGVKLRTQIVRVWSRFFRQLDPDISEEIWFEINSVICDEHGVNSIYEPPIGFYKESEKCRKYFERLEQIEELFDVIEAVFRAITKVPEILNQRVGITPDHIIADLNSRFRENDFGYEYNRGNILRIDNNLLHEDIIDQVIHLTNEPLFQNANEEFLSALTHLKNGRNKEALSDSLKAFESTMKIIIHDFKWDYQQNDTASKLIQKCLDKELIPKFLQSQFSALRTTLEAGIPTIRNKNSGHGQGPVKIVVPDSLATYSIYMTGTCINYLIELYKEKKPSS